MDTHQRYDAKSSCMMLAGSAALVLVLAGCGDGLVLAGEHTPPATVVPIPTATVAATPGPTVTPTATLVPAPTPALPDPIPTQQPTATAVPPPATVTPAVLVEFTAYEPDLAIGACESGGRVYGVLDYTAVNYDWPRSTATGAYQFLNVTVNHTINSYAPQHSQYLNMLAKDIPPHVQDELFWALYSNEGTAPWAASRSCWSQWINN